jgi:hypothetical protein
MKSITRNEQTVVHLGRKDCELNVNMRFGAFNIMNVYRKESEIRMNRRACHLFYLFAHQLKQKK